MPKLYSVWIIRDQTYDTIFAYSDKKNTLSYVWWLLLYATDEENRMKKNGICATKKFFVCGSKRVFAKRRLTLLIAKIGQNMFSTKCSTSPYLLHFMRCDVQRKILSNLLTYNSLMFEIRNACVVAAHIVHMHNKLHGLRVFRYNSFSYFLR